MEAIKQFTPVDPLAITTWRRIKIKYPNALVWVRISDHYHTFSKDAITVHNVSKVEVFPCLQEHWHCTITCERAETVMKRMIMAGFQVALCEAVQ